MKFVQLCIYSFGVVILYSCQAPHKVYELYTMKQFDVSNGNFFVQRINSLSPVNEISIADTKADGNDFVVNGQWIFLDDVQTNHPNYYNYKKWAAELNVPPDSLKTCLNAFYKIGVNDFSRDSGYYRFKVLIGLTSGRGYVYSDNSILHPGDTLPATSIQNKDYHFKIVLSKQVDKNWFEYYELIPGITEANKKHKYPQD